MTDKSRELMPCPFCGEKPMCYLDTRYKDWNIECDNVACIQVSLRHPDLESAQNTWNNRRHAAAPRRGGPGNERRM